MLDETRIPLLDFNDFFSRQTLERAMASAEDGRASVDGVKPRMASCASSAIVGPDEINCSDRTSS